MTYKTCSSILLFIGLASGLVSTPASHADESVYAGKSRAVPGVLADPPVTGSPMPRSSSLEGARPPKIGQLDKPVDGTDPTPTRGLRAKALSVTYVDVTENVILPGAKRLGMNVGSRDPYGAAQYIKNLIPNPGFESGEYGTLLHVDGGSTGDTIYQAFWDTSWNIDHWGIGQPEGFWDGGTYEILFGPAKGRIGTINHFSHSPDNRYTFELDTNGVVPNELDVVAARKQLPGITGYPGMDTGAVDTTTTRPGSPGTQSLLLQYGGEAWISSYTLYMDSFWRDSDASAGKMIIIEGPYRLALARQRRCACDAHAFALASGHPGPSTLVAPATRAQVPRSVRRADQCRHREGCAQGRGQASPA